MVRLALRRSVTGVVCVLVAVWIASARAEGPTSPTAPASESPSTDHFLPVQYGYRSATLPSRVARVDVSTIVSRAPSAGTNTLLTLDLGYGITDRLEAGFSIPALQLSPAVEGFDPAVYLTAGITPTDWLTLVPLARITAPIRASDLWTMDLNLEAWLSLSPSVGLFTSPTFTVSFARPAQSSLLLPLGVSAQLLDRLFVQARAGLAVNRTDPRFMAARPNVLMRFDQTLLVVSGTVGYTVGRPDRTLADLYVTWLWPGSAAAANDWSLILGVSVYLPQLHRTAGLLESRRSAPEVVQR